MLMVRSHDGIFFLKTAIKDLDNAICEARNERRRCPVIRDYGRDGALRIGFQVLD